MAFNSGLGSALQGFGKGYLGALQFGERQKQGYMNTKLKQDDLTFRKGQAASDAAFRQFQIKDSMEAAQDRRDSAKLTATDRAKALRTQAGIAASSALNEDLKMISGLQGPDQLRAWNTARARQTQILGDVLDPEELQKHLDGVLTMPGAPMPGMTQPGFVAGAPMGNSKLLDVGKFEGSQGPLEPGKPRTFQNPTDNTFTQVGRSPFDPRADAARKIMMAGMGGFNPAGMAQLGSAVSNMYQPAAAGIPEQQKDFGYEQNLKPEVGQVPVLANYKLGALDQATVEGKQANTAKSKIQLDILQQTKPDVIKQAQLKTDKLVEGITDSKFNREYKKGIFKLQQDKFALAKTLGAATMQMNALKYDQGERRLANAEIMTQIKAAYDPMKMASATGLEMARLIDTRSRTTDKAQQKRIDDSIATLSKDRQRFMALGQMSADKEGKFLDGMQALKDAGYSDDGAMDAMLGWATGDTLQDSAFIPVGNPAYAGLRNNIDRNTAFPGTNPAAKRANAAGNRQQAGNPLGLPGGNHPGPGASRPQVRQFGR